MNDIKFCHSIGALLYCPANSTSIVNSIVSENFEAPYSLALCLEDTIRDDRIKEAEEQLITSLLLLKKESESKQFYMPKTFIRVRNPRQISVLYAALKVSRSLLTGFIIPKFSMENADEYIRCVTRLNEESEKNIYMMPILESHTMIDLRYRYDILYQLKDKLDKISELVLNIRVGGNDLCHAFGYRRRNTESIHDIKPIYNILADIMTVFGADYVVSGPVWEYYNGDGWDTGMMRELTLDRLNGFVGKTVIHPNQIALVNQAYQVTKEDYEDALSILNWSPDIVGLVTGSTTNGRMNEYKIHANWAQKIIHLYQIYGLTND